MISKTSELPDIDLDVSRRDDALASLSNFAVASQIVDGQLVPHKNGIYFQKIPIDPITDLAVFEYKCAEEFGYFKVDLIPNHVYDLVESNEEIDRLMDEPVNWNWFKDKRFYENDDSAYRLTHLSNYHHLCGEMYPPNSVEDVAMLLALIRPRKKYLIGDPWSKIQKVIWKKLDSENQKHYFFKKSHGVAFALLVTLHAKIIARHLKV